MSIFLINYNKMINNLTLKMYKSDLEQDVKQMGHLVECRCTK